MKKKYKLLSILLCSILLVSLSSFTQQRQAASLELEKISDRLYQILGGRGANGGFYWRSDIYGQAPAHPLL